MRPPNNVLKTLIWNSVDLLKAGTGEYNGEAAATIKNLVSDQIKTISVGWDDPTAFLEEARTRLHTLGGFVIHDEARLSYYQGQVDVVIEKAAQQNGRGHSQLP